MLEKMMKCQNNQQKIYLGQRTEVNILYARNKMLRCQKEYSEYKFCGDV